MLSQIRQISDGNYNTVFVKNKEQKFNLDKEIHDLECWKQSRNHVYRKEERELLSHLDKLKQQQEYLHHLDEERSGHVRGSHIPSQRRHTMSGSVPLSHHTSVLSPPGSFQEIGPPHTTPEQQSRTAINTPGAMLPPVVSGADNRVLHRTEACTNICVICQLPRWSLGHQPPGEAACCCHEQEGTRAQTRRFTTTGHENHTAFHPASPIQVGQRRHSLMMARLNENQHERKPHPPERGHTGINHRHDHVNHPSDNVHIHRHVHNHIHMHHDHRHHPSHQGDHVNEHAKNMHGAYDATDHHGHHSTHENTRHNGHVYHHGHPRAHTNAHRESAHVSDHHRSHRHGNHGESHTPSNSPRRYSRQSFSHHEHVNNYDGRRNSGSLGPSAHDSDTRTRDHELHWDRHQVCKLKGMITDPHYKEQLEVENGRTYPWSGLYPSHKARAEDIEDLKNCRYLRFSKLNLMNMKENPEEEVEVFERKTPP